MPAVSVVYNHRKFRLDPVPANDLPDLSGGPAFKCWAFSILEDGPPPAQARAMTRGKVQVATAVLATVPTPTGMLGVWRQPPLLEDDQATPLGEVLLHSLLHAGQHGRFLWGLDGPERPWQGGQIIDPAQSKIYRANAVLSADGSLLVVRGYVGVSMFARHQVWGRATGTFG